MFRSATTSFRIGIVVLASCFALFGRAADYSPQDSAFVLFLPDSGETGMLRLTIHKDVIIAQGAVSLVHRFSNEEGRALISRAMKVCQSSFTAIESSPRLMVVFGVREDKNELRWDIGQNHPDRTERIEALLRFVRDVEVSAGITDSRLSAIAEEALAGDAAQEPNQAAQPTRGKAPRG